MDMLKEKTTDKSIGTSQHPPRTVFTSFSDGHWVSSHSHDQAQLLYAIEGVLVIGTVTGRWVLPSNRALWIPPNTEHWTRMVGAVQLRSLYLQQLQAPRMPAHCCIVEVSPLLRELILSAMTIREPFSADTRNEWIMKLLVDELDYIPLHAMHLPLPDHPKLAHVCHLLIKSPHLDLAECAALLAVNPRTLRRWFMDDLGMTFGKWRRQARLQLALEYLAKGESVLGVAIATGYANHSAFSTMLRNELGVSPAEFVTHLRRADQLSTGSPVAHFP
ncbi:AraC family transcriptional regulator [Pseudomonas sp. Ma2-10]